jgi:serine protease Do
MSVKGSGSFISSFLIVLVSLVVGAVAGLMISREHSSDAASIPVSASSPVMETVDFITDPAVESVSEEHTDEIREDRANAIVKAAAVVGPCVVSINVFQTQIVQSNYPIDDFWSNFFFPRRYRREVQSLGSGFIISGKGHILTNEHVVHDATRILVTLEDGTEYEASVIGTDMRTDLALLKIDVQNPPVAPLGDSESLLLGEWVIAIGNPFGYLLDDPKPSVTVGVVSALKRDVKPETGVTGVFANMIQTDASINPGNSGGPLVDSNGLVIGVNTFIFSKSGGSLGIGFAVPIDRAKRVVKDLVQYQKVRWPWIGIHPQELTNSLREGLKIEGDKTGSGIIVADIDPESPAENAGLKRGDIITALNGRRIRSVFDWEGEITDIILGDPLQISILRKEEMSTITIKTEFLPTDVAKKVESNLGILLTDLTPRVRSQIGAVSETGAVVVGVKSDELGEEGGVLPFDVILKINNQDIESAAKAVEYLDNLNRGTRNLIVLEREGKLIYRSLITR